MPIYEFECQRCHCKTTALVMSRARVGDVRCAKCGSADLEKLFSRFATPRSQEARGDALGDPSSVADLDEKDPASVARWMRQMGDNMGEDFPGVSQALEEERANGADSDRAEEAGSESDWEDG